MTSIAPEVDYLGALDSDWDIPCEVEFQSPVCEMSRLPGHWIVHFACCTAPVVFCDPCLQMKLLIDSVHCLECETVYTPGSLAYRLIEPLNRKA